MAFEPANTLYSCRTATNLSTGSSRDRNKHSERRGLCFVLHLSVTFRRHCCAGSLGTIWTERFFFLLLCVSLFWQRTKVLAAVGRANSLSHFAQVFVVLAGLTLAAAASATAQFRHDPPGAPPPVLPDLLLSTVLLLACGLLMKRGQRRCQR